jgi:Protein kinase domain.
VKLFDFGLARELDHSDEDNAEDSNVYVMSSEVGSLRYMSPEVANGENTITKSIPTPSVRLIHSQFLHSEK